VVPQTAAAAAVAAAQSPRQGLGPPQRAPISASVHAPGKLAATHARQLPALAPRAPLQKPARLSALGQTRLGQKWACGFVAPSGVGR
jgi:hypothetical protein